MTDKPQTEPKADSAEADMAALEADSAVDNVPPVERDGMAEAAAVVENTPPIERDAPAEAAAAIENVPPIEVGPTFPADPYAMMSASAAVLRQALETMKDDELLAIGVAEGLGSRGLSRDGLIEEIITLWRGRSLPGGNDASAADRAWDEAHGSPYPAPATGQQAMSVRVARAQAILKGNSRGS